VVKHTDAGPERNPLPTVADTSTKERILQAALRLFAENGFAATSTGAIAGEVGITKGALYRHFTNKQDILDCIVEQMRTHNAEHAGTFDIAPAELSTDATPTERAAALSRIKAFSLSQFRYWTENDFAVRFRHLLTLEQYRNPKLAALLKEYLTGGIVAHTRELMRAASAGIQDADAEVLALEYFAPILMLINAADDPNNTRDAARLVEAHIDSFMHMLENRR
jgi:AcrR family transcriptional regulator